MLLASYGDHSVGVVVDDKVRPLDGVLRRIGWQPTHGVSAMRFLIEHFDEVTAGADQLGDPVLLADVRLRPPVPDPTKIVAAPINYRDHQAEMSQTSTVGDLGFFLKAPSSLLPAGGVVQLPYLDRRFDQEGELGVVVGRTARNVGIEDALDHVFGYTGLMDITLRGGEDRSMRKSFETFTPLGPVIAARDSFGDPQAVELECSVSGQTRQKASTRDLIWGVADLVAYASSVTTLHPGDIIATGTPAGVGPLEPGDTIRLRLTGLPDLEVTVAADDAVSCPTRGAGKGPVPPPPQPR